MANLSDKTTTVGVPDASPTQDGLVTTGTQSFAGAKTFGGDVFIGAATPNAAVGDASLLLGKDAVATTMRFVSGLNGQAADADINQLDFYHDGNNGYQSVASIRHSASDGIDAHGNLDFYTRDDTVPELRLRMAADGNFDFQSGNLQTNGLVGIGQAPVAGSAIRVAAPNASTYSASAFNNKIIDGFNTTNQGTADFACIVRDISAVAGYAGLTFFSPANARTAMAVKLAQSGVVDEVARFDSSGLVSIPNKFSVGSGAYGNVADAYLSSSQTDPRWDVLADTVATGQSVLRIQPRSASSSCLMVGEVNGGTAGHTAFQTSQFSGSSTFPILLNPFGGNIGIGNNKTNVDADLQIHTASNGAEIVLVRGNETTDPTALGNVIGMIGFASHTNDANPGNTNSVDAEIRVEADVTAHSGTRHDARMIFATKGAVGPGSAATEAMRIDSNQYVILANTSASQDVQTDSNNRLVSTSDMRLKEDMGELQSGTEAIMALKPRFYHWIDRPEDANPELGFFAQEVAPYIPEAAPYNAEKDLYGFNTRAVVATLVKAYQELRTEFEDYKANN